jgi:hypothetical protein
VHNCINTSLTAITQWHRGPKEDAGGLSAVPGVPVRIVSIIPVRQFSLRHLSSKSYETMLSFPRGWLLCVHFRVLQILKRIKEEVNVNFKDDGSKNMALLAEIKKRYMFSFLKMCLFRNQSTMWYCKSKHKMSNKKTRRREKRAYNLCVTRTKLQTSDMTNFSVHFPYRSSSKPGMHIFSLERKEDTALLIHFINN